MDRLRLITAIRFRTQASGLSCLSAADLVLLTLHYHTLWPLQPLKSPIFFWCPCPIVSSCLTKSSHPSSLPMGGLKMVACHIRSRYAHDWWMAVSPVTAKQTPATTSKRYVNQHPPSSSISFLRERILHSRTQSREERLLTLCRIIMSWTKGTCKQTAFS